MNRDKAFSLALMVLVIVASLGSLAFAKDGGDSGISGGSSGSSGGSGPSVNSSQGAAIQNNSASDIKQEDKSQSSSAQQNSAVSSQGSTGNNSRSVNDVRQEDRSVSSGTTRNSSSATGNISNANSRMENVLSEISDLINNSSVDSGAFFSRILNIFNNKPNTRNNVLTSTSTNPNDRNENAKKDNNVAPAGNASSTNKGNIFSQAMNSLLNVVNFANNLIFGTPTPPAPTPVTPPVTVTPPATPPTTGSGPIINPPFTGSILPSGQEVTITGTVERRTDLGLVGNTGIQTLFPQGRFIVWATPTTAVFDHSGAPINASSVRAGHNITVTGALTFTPGPVFITAVKVTQIIDNSI